MRTIGERLSGLRWRLRAMCNLWRPGAQPSMSFLPPEPREVESCGRIDHPVPNSRIYEDEPTRISGWVLFPSSPTARVEVLIDGKPAGRARLGIVRPDVGAAIDLPQAEIAGFELSGDVGGLDTPGTRTVKVVATSAAGERLELESHGVRFLGGGRDGKKAEERRPPPQRTPRPDPSERLSAVVFTHQLNLGGAQLYLMDLLRQLLADGHVDLTVVSALDGLLREELEELGVPVHISGLVPHDDLASYTGRIEEMVHWLGDRGFDVALVNTATTLSLPGAEAAEILGIPVVWAIHESFDPREMWSTMTPQVLTRSEATLAGAHTLVFEATSTQRIFERYVDPSRCKMLPYGLDLAPIDAARAGFDRAAERRRRGIPEDAQLVVCIGTVEPRKAQTMLAMAFDLVATRHPRAHLAFVGGRDDLESDALRGYIDSAEASDRIELVPITPDVDAWYGIADLLVCASDVESLPRTVLEAMLWGTPVLATNVFGLPELIDDGVTGWLCESRDLAALADGLDRALGTDPAERERIAVAARSLVEERHDLARYGERVFEELKRAAEQRERDRTG